MSTIPADALHLEQPGHGHAADHHESHTPGFFTRWFMSTNHKDIGTLYLIFAICTGIIGGSLSGIMRWELMEPGIQVLNRAWPLGAGTANFDEWTHHWNALITAHGLIMVFFMVMPAMMGGFGRAPVMVWLGGSAGSGAGVGVGPGLGA
jgi:cytochrome c oxidase subunit 1